MRFQRMCGCCRKRARIFTAPGNLHVPALSIRRTAGDMPSRVADNFYWLGRYLERLENVARLSRTVLTRIARGTMLPRDLPDMEALIACMVDAGIVSAELSTGAGYVQLADLILRALARDTGIVARLTGRGARPGGHAARPAERGDARHDRP